MRTLVLTASTVLCALALLPVASAQAAPAQTASAQPAAKTCSANALTIPFLTTVPTARKPGQALVQKISVTNATKATVRYIFFDFELITPPKVAHAGHAPQMWWRRGTTAAWHTMPLPNWTPPRSSNQPGFWETNDTAFGHIAARAKTAMEFRLSFRSRNHSGWYAGLVAFGSTSCGTGHELIGSGEADFYYQP
jgi:hypothetical protein